MSNENNIQNFDNFFKESFGNFQPEPPAGVFEAIQTQMGAATTAGAASTTASTLAKLGISKLIVGAVAVVAVATTVYISTSNGDKATSKTEQAVTENTSQTANADKLPASTNDDATESTTGADATQNTANGLPNATENGTHSNTNIQSLSNGNAVPPAGTNSGNNGSSEDGLKPGGTITPPVEKEKQKISLYFSDTKPCLGDIITYNIADDLSKNIYRVNFGDGTSVLSTPGKPITHKYKDAGAYTVSAAEISGNKIVPEQSLTVYGVKASFTAENTEKSTFKFTNNSKGAVHYSWFFGDNSEMVQQMSPIHTYSGYETGEYKVKLIALNEIGCVDSFSLKVKQTFIYEHDKPIVPNVFSPNGDGINDRFDIGIRNEADYHLLVYDNTGNLVFESFDKENTWDGTNMHTKEECPATTYMVVFIYKIKGFDEQKLQGRVTIKR